MQKTVAVADLGERFRAVFDEVIEDHVPYIVTRGQQPEAVLVPYSEFQRLLKSSDAEVLRRFDEVRARIRERLPALPLLREPVPVPGIDLDDTSRLWEID